MSLRAHRLTVALGLVVAALALGAAGSLAAVSQSIHAYFDADGHLMFTYVDGSAVGTTIPPGAYQVVYDNFGADDLADDHAFHLSGPGIDFAPAASIVQTTFNVTFQANGSYTLQDDLHPAIGRRMFVATNAGGGEAAGASPSGGTAGSSSSSTKSSTKAVSGDIVGSALKPFRGTLAAALTPAGKVALRFHGRSVASLKSGRYAVAVEDRTAKGAFELQRVEKKPLLLTGVPFVGKRTATITLDAGQWFFFSGSGKKSFFVVHA